MHACRRATRDGTGALSHDGLLTGERGHEDDVDEDARHAISVDPLLRCVEPGTRLREAATTMSSGWWLCGARCALRM